MKTVAISLLGTTLDNRGKGKKRWERWRPTVSLCQHEDLVIDRLELVFQDDYQALADIVTADIHAISPETDVRHHLIEIDDPWDFENIYGALHDFARGYRFDLEREDYLLHITTGTHVAQICLFLLNEAHYLRGRLIQTAPAKRDEAAPAHYQIIDLDLSRYDRIASRFSREHDEGTVYLKGGIPTRNAGFNKTIAQLEQVSLRSKEPILLTGPTGAGKSLLAKRIYELRKQRGLVTGQLVEVNCATLRGDNAMSALFGHVKGAFTGAVKDRKGLLLEADRGVLFLDEIGELGLDEQAMLLRAIEDKRFMPFGSDRESGSDFQLISGSNRNLQKQVEKGLFRDDLLARINLWTYALPSLKQRIEDLEPNIDYELEKFAEKAGALVSFNKAGRSRYLAFAISPEAAWKANFRDLNASITRMATLAPGGRITAEVVDDEVACLRRNWQATTAGERAVDVGVYVDQPLDLFEQIQLAGVIKVCKESASAAEAGRRLFDISRQQKTSVNDSHRLVQFLRKYGLKFEQLKF
ncbi:RNA repair transcriptional activator RtcR [Methylomarinum vadi]|uniref:RNA repair transcriptional activator RtcR n=1 Tax=Methylomarinum vadi TaxID=438855 RepID=UPI0004DF7C53|nr:RNA repair transcriptional activator RtcR [Methylomarinum vadi]